MRRDIYQKRVHITMKHLKLIKLCFFISLSLFVSLFKNVQAQESQKDLNLLIFSSTHGPVTYTKQKVGQIHVEMVSFDRISEIEVNGIKKDLESSRHVLFYIPYDISGPNLSSATIEIVAYTEKGHAKKIFTIHGGQKPKPKKSPLQLIGILGVSTNDNIEKVDDSSEKTSAEKMAATVASKYSIPVGVDSTFQVKGVLLREKYAKDENKIYEISYTQLAVAWIERKTPLGKLTAELGFNDIRTQNSNPLLGDTHSAKQAFISASMKHKLEKGSNWSLALKSNYNDTVEEPDNMNNDTDGLETTISAATKLKILGGTAIAKASYEIKDAKGKYEDYDNKMAKIIIRYPIGAWIPSLEYGVSQETKSIVDPSQGNVRPVETISTGAMKLAYRVSPKIIPSLTYKHKNLSSNVDDTDYNQNTMTLSLTIVL